jgi:predicted ATPase
VAGPVLLWATPAQAWSKAQAGQVEEGTAQMRQALSELVLWRRRGQLREVRQRLARLYGWCTEGFNTSDLVAARSLLQELAGAAGPAARP